jgi:hypothetical protein
MTPARLLASLAAATLCAACGPKPTMPLAVPEQLEAVGSSGQSPRVTVERIGVFKDDLAYGDRRGVYIIRDTRTGREFIGVSGVGISELGSHGVQNGKNSNFLKDER